MHETISSVEKAIQQINERWYRTMNSIPLSEYCISITDCPHSTPKWTNSGKLVIRNQYIKNGRLDLSNPSFTDNENFTARCKRAKPIAGDIIITREAPMGEVCIVPDNVECCLGQRMVLLKPNPSKCDSRYLLYALMSSYVQHQILWSEGTGTTVSNLRIPHLERLKIPVFPLDEQKRIASLLSSLDDKIALNTKINKHLEQMAQTIFKSWFVDFEPNKPFTEVVQVLGGGTPKTTTAEYWDGSIPFFTPKDASGLYTLTTEKSLTEAGLKKCNSRLYPINTVFVTARGTVGKLAMAGVPMAMNQSCYALIGNSGYGQYFVYHLALETVEHLKNKASGAVFDAIVTRDFESELIAAPPIEAVNIFEDKVRPIYKAILNNIDESARLATLRDTLLPKLMSGEIEMRLEVLS